MFSNATKKRFLLITFLLGTGLLATSTLAAENQGPQLLTGGQIHLPQHDQPLSVSLKGEWELYWGSFLYTDAMNIQALRPCLISIPHTPSQSASNCPQIERYGYGTLRASIFFDSNESQSANNTYFLRIPDIPGAWRIWINGELRGSAGRIGKTRRATKPQYLIEFFEITPVDSRIEIVIEFANFHDYRASITQPPTLSSRRPFEISFFYNNFFLMLINGAFLFLFVYFMILYILDRSYKENLYFALFVFCLLFRQIIMGQEMMSIVMHPIPWRVKFAIWHIMIPMQLLTFNNFIHSLFPRESRPEVGRGLFWFAMVYAVFCLVTPASIFARTLSIPQAVAVIYGIYVHVVIIMAIIRQRDRAWILILGSLVMFAAVIHDIAFSRGLVQTGRLLNVGALVFV
ncbi:MAG: membrane protein, partial [Spirochaetaceae bacterium]